MLRIRICMDPNYLESWIRIRIKVRGQIRILIEVKSRIRIKAMQIRNSFQPKYMWKKQIVATYMFQEGIKKLFLDTYMSLFILSMMRGVTRSLTSSHPNRRLSTFAFCWRWRTVAAFTLRTGFKCQRCTLAVGWHASGIRFPREPQQAEYTRTLEY